MKSKIKRSTDVILTFTMFFFLVCSTLITACAEKASKTVEAGSTWSVAEKYTISGTLTIGDGATVKAPDGYLLTMTVDGVETPIKAGTYAGEIVLTPAKKITKALYNGSMTRGENVDYRTALFIDAGEVIEESSVLSALIGGTYDNKSASGMTITSDNSLFNGIIINDTDYTVSNVTMTANGAGGNDFTGYGAGIAITGTSNAVIDNFSFTATGPIRHGIYVGGEFEKDNLTVTVKNSFLKTDGSVGDVAPGTGMSTVPWVLGLETYAHVRTQMNAGYANVTYENSTLLSDGWGILSTDDVSVPARYGDYAIKLNVKDSIVDITGTSGYGTYSIGACHNVFNNTIMGNTEYSSTKYGLTYAMIGANEYSGGEFINGTNVTSMYGVMYHKNQTGITKVEDSAFNTFGATFLIKHCFPVINVSNSKLDSETGVIVQLMSSDDPGLGANCYTEVLDAASAPKDKNHDIYHINKADTRIFSTQLKDVIYDAQASFSDMEINGDIYNSVSGIDDDDLHLLGQNLILSLDDVDVTGVISSANAIHRNYSFYLSRETDADGNKIALNADGYQIDGTWEIKQGMFGGGMPGGMPGGEGDRGGGMPGGEGGRGGGGMPGGMPGGEGAPDGGMPGGMEMFGGGTSMEFIPATDANGNYVVIGKEKHELYEGVIVTKDATYLGDLINSPAPAVNNGMIVSLTGGTVWTVTGTSYLTSLSIDNSRVTAPEGYNVAMTVNGAKTEIKAGKTYTGDIVLSLSKK